MIKTNIKATGITMTSEISDYLEKRISTIDKLIDSGDESAFMNIELSRTTKHHQTGDIFCAEVNLHIKGKELRAVAESGDINTSVDLVKDELQREIVSYKTKKTDLIRRGATRLKNIIKGFYWKK